MRTLRPPRSRRSCGVIRKRPPYRSPTTEWSSRKKNLAVGIAEKRLCASMHVCDCSSLAGSHLAFRVLARPMSAAGPGPGPGSDEVEMDAGDPDPIAAEDNGRGAVGNEEWEAKHLRRRDLGGSEDELEDDDDDFFFETGRGPLYAVADYTPSLMATAIHLAEWKVCHNVKARGFEKLLKLLRGFVMPWREWALPDTWYSVEQCLNVPDFKQ
eukprot:jgi/Tetstr1/441343/TSEL_029594.t1